MRSLSAALNFVSILQQNDPDIHKYKKTRLLRLNSQHNKLSTKDMLTSISTMTKNKLIFLVLRHSNINIEKEQILMKMLRSPLHNYG
jgi:hypothetical protein